MGDGLRWGVEPLCAVLTEHDIPISPSTYYEWVTRKPSTRALRDEGAQPLPTTAAGRDKHRIIMRDNVYRGWGEGATGPPHTAGRAVKGAEGSEISRLSTTR